MYLCLQLQHVHKKLKTSRCALPLPRPQDTEGVDHPSTSTKRSCSIFKRFLDLYEQERLEDPNSASTVSILKLPLFPFV